MLRAIATARCPGDAAGDLHLGFDCPPFALAMGGAVIYTSLIIFIIFH
jgi:hypothetical protein